MEVNGDYKFKAPIDQVWQVLMSKDALSKSLPGCEKLHEIGHLKYETVLKVGVASVKGTYNGTITVGDLEDFKRYRILVEGAGSQSHLNGDAFFELESDDFDAKYRTIIRYKGMANIGGSLAGVSHRMLQPVARLLIGSFFKSMEKQIHELGISTQPGYVAYFDQPDFDDYLPEVK